MARSDQLGFFDRHAEKVAIGAAALVLVAVAFFKVVKSPHSSGEIGFSSKIVSPAKMDAELKDAAERTRNAIMDKRPEQQEAPDPLRGLQRNFAKPIGMDARDVIAPAAPWTIKDMEPGPVGVKSMPKLKLPPAPDKTYVWAGSELIMNPDLDSEHKAIDQLVAHVTSVLDYGQMIESWKEAVRESGASMRILFLSIQIERQELLSNGNWSAGELIDLPEESLEIPDFEDGTPSEIQQMIDMFAAVGMQRAVLNPAYPEVFWPEAGTWGGWIHHLPRTEVSSLANAEIWPNQLQPDPVRLKFEDQIIEQRRNASREPVKRERTRTTAPAPAMGGAGAPPADPFGGAAPADPFGGTGAGPSAPSRTSNPSANDRDREANDRRAAQLVVSAQEDLAKGRQSLKENNISDAETSIERSIRKFEQALEMSSSVEGAAVGLSEAKAAQYEARLPQPTPLPSLADMCRNGKLQLWAHDTTLEPGKTYKYRLVISILNPIFDVTMLGQPNAPEPVMTVASKWSEPVSIDKPVKFCVTGADNRGKAKISVYRMNNGLLRCQKVSVKPGDIVGTPESLDYIDPMTSRVGLDQAEVDFSTGYVVVDVNDEKRILPRGAVGLHRKTVEVTLVTPDGQLITRTAVDDKENEEYSELSRQNTKDEAYLENTMGQ